MNTIRLIGQVISSTNYATNKLFNFSPELLKAAAENFLAAGVTELEIPVAVLDPESKFPEKGIDEEAVRKTISLLPAETKTIGSYFGPPQTGGDTAAYLATSKKKLDYMIEYFPDFRYTMLHPPGKDAGLDTIKGTVGLWAELAEHAAGRKESVQLCLHNHYDGGCETAEQVRAYLEEIKSVNLPSLTWGPDTGHCHGMCDEYLAVFAEYASLIGNHFHIKARVPAFDQLHGGDLYDGDRDIWGNKAEVGRGLYSGFVNCADPEIHTPFHEVFKLIREKAQPTEGLVCGAMEIDIPRQHPRLEVMCAVMYLKCVHGVEAGKSMTYEEIVKGVFAGA